MPVQCISLQNDGKILVGGYFTSYNGTNAKNIIRLNSDGSIDNTFNSEEGFDNTVNVIVVQTDGKILIGGKFISYNNVTSNRIIRLNSDGSKDTTFNPGIGFDNEINTLSIQNDGKIIIGGAFTYFNESNVRRLVRLNSDGSIDNSFNNYGTGFNNTVYSVALQTDGKILVGGRFTSYNGSSSLITYLTRLNSDGSKDTTFNKAVSIDNTVKCIFIQNDSKIIIGGDFFNNTIGRIARINSSGSIDSTFLSSPGIETTSSLTTVNTVSVKDNGEVIVGGNFDSYNESTVKNVVAINSYGNLNKNFTFSTMKFTDYVKTVAVQNDEKIIISGNFSYYNGINISKILRLNVDGNIDESFLTDTVFNMQKYNINSIVIQTDGKILVGGQFVSNQGVIRNSIIRLNSDGSIDSTFNPDTMRLTQSSSINTIALQNDGKILVGGYNFNGNITRLNSDGSIDTSFVIGTGFNDYVSTIVLQNDGNILVGGNFTNYFGTSSHGVIRLKTDGSVNTSFTNLGSSVNYVKSIAIQNDGKILVGGNMSNAPGQSIFRFNFDGSSDNTFNPNDIKNSIPTSMVIQNDGKILVGGIKNSSFKGVIRLNSDGSIDSDFNIGTGFDNDVNTITLKSNGKILIGGRFFYYNNIDSAYFVELEGGINAMSTESNERKKELKIFPNPTSDFLKWISKEKFNRVMILDNSGRLMNEKIVFDNQISVKELSSGIYFIILKSDQNTIYLKFIKK